MKGMIEPSSNRNNYILTWRNSSRTAAASTFSWVCDGFGVFSWGQAVASQPCPQLMSRGAIPPSDARRKWSSWESCWSGQVTSGVSSFTHLLVGFAQGAESGRRKELTPLFFLVPGIGSWMLPGSIQWWPFPSTGCMGEYILHGSLLP